MLKTPATRIYWKQESKNRTVFSKLAACKWLSSEPTSGFAGEYLGNGHPLGFPVTTWSHVPRLTPHPEESPELCCTCNDDLSYDACKDIPRDKARRGSFGVYHGIRERAAHYEDVR